MTTSIPPSMDSLDEISSLTTLASDEDEIFWCRFNCINNWFLKSSTKTKLKLLNLMVDAFKDDSYLTIFLSSCNYTRDKLIVYSECYPTTNYIYDIYLKDHNRGLQTECLQDTIHKDMIWFGSLTVFDQARTFLELLKVSGGAINKAIYKIIRDRVTNKAKDTATAKASQKFEEKTDLNSLFLPKSPGSEPEGKTDKEKIEKAPKTPLELEIEKKKKIWDDEMMKFKIAIEGKPVGSKGKGNDNPKSPKSSKSESKKLKKPDKNLVDRVQVLPVWLVKKIFGYLDAKTLKKISEVNHYWAYVVEDMAKDKKNMAAVQKIVKKMQANLPEETVPDLIPPPEKPTKLTQVEKKMINLVERGAVDKRLRTVIKQPNEEKTLLERAITLPDTHIRVPTQSYEMFPRAKGDKPALLTLSKAVHTETGVFQYGKKPEGGAVTIVELTNYNTIDSAIQTTEGVREMQFTPFKLHLN